MTQYSYEGLTITE